MIGMQHARQGLLPYVAKVQLSKCITIFISIQVQKLNIKYQLLQQFLWTSNIDLPVNGYFSFCLTK